MRPLPETIDYYWKEEGDEITSPRIRSTVSKFWKFVYYGTVGVLWLVCLLADLRDLLTVKYLRIRRTK